LSDTLNYLDSAEGRSESYMRRRRCALYDAYFSGRPYENEREWRSLLGYSAEVSAPAIVVNYPRLVVERPAHFAFDRVAGVEAADPAAQEFVERAIAGLEIGGISSLDALLSEAAIEASIKGDALLVFDPSGLVSAGNAGETPALPVSVIPAEDYTLECDPHDASKIAFIRIEYRISDGNGKETRHRRELHPDRILEFIGDAPKGRRIWFGGNAAHLAGAAPDEPKEWRLVSAAKNPLGEIPAVVVRNRPRVGRAYGESDFADLLTIFDDINWKYSQRSRNISRTMNAILKSVNGRILNDVISENGVLSVIGEGAEVGYLINDADMREISTHIAELRRALFEISGVTVLDAEKLSGYGALSGFALSVLYEPLIALAEKKRRTIGGAVERFLSKIVRAGWKLGLIETEPESFGVRIKYGAMFRESERELAEKQSRLLAAIDAGLLTKEQAGKAMETS